MEFMDVVKEICNTKSTDCRSLNKKDLARKLMDIVNIPDNAKIMEIPLDWSNQVGILFVIPGDDNYYALYAGHWLNDTESIQLAITGKVTIESEGRFLFDFYEKEKEISLDYFKRKETKMSKIYFLTKSGLLMDNDDIARAHYIMNGEWIDSDNFNQVREIAKICKGIEREINPSVKRLIKDGNRIQAIMVYRDRHPGMGLVEAKNAVDKIAKKMKGQR